LAKSDYLPFIRSHVIPKLIAILQSVSEWRGFIYRHSDFKKFIYDDLSKLFVNLVNAGPVTPEFTNDKVYNRLLLSLKQTFKTNYLRIHWTDVYQFSPYGRYWIVDTDLTPFYW